MTVWGLKFDKKPRKKRKNRNEVVGKILYEGNRGGNLESRCFVCVNNWFLSRTLPTLTAKWTSELCKSILLGIRKYYAQERTHREPNATFRFLARKSIDIGVTRISRVPSGDKPARFEMLRVADDAPDCRRSKQEYVLACFVFRSARGSTWRDTNFM